MPVLTLGDVLDRAHEFEGRLEAYYKDLRDRAENDGVRMLVTYLARHRRHLPEALENLEPAQVQHVKHVPFKYAGPKFVAADLFAGKELPSTTDARSVLRTGIELVESLVVYYRHVAGEELGGDATSLFKSLLRIEETHLVELKKIQAMDYF